MTSEVLLDRCRPGHMCPEAEEAWALVEEAREDDVALATGATRTRAYVLNQRFRDHQVKCMNNCPVCRGGGYLLKGETLDVLCWSCDGTGGYHDVRLVTSEAELLEALESPEPFYMEAP